MEVIFNSKKKGPISVTFALDDTESNLIRNLARANRKSLPKILIESFELGLGVQSGFKLGLGVQSVGALISTMGKATSNATKKMS